MSKRNRDKQAQPVSGQQKGDRIAPSEAAARNERCSFSDIWEGGMPGYLIWRNARLYEIKHLLKKTGSICVHVDWHKEDYNLG